MLSRGGTIKCFAAIFNADKSLEVNLENKHCWISYREGLGMSLCIMGLTTQDPYIQKEHTECALSEVCSFFLKCPAIHTFVTYICYYLFLNIWVLCC